MKPGPSLYNPRDTQPEQLDALLTGRTALLDEILANLREQAQGVTRQHWLLRGQRGMGKTHLAGVIHYRVKTDAVLNQTYLPLWLGEADTYEVYSAATLLKTIGERLAEETKDSALLARLDKLEGVGDAEGYFQEVAELLSAVATQRERVLLVLMENLDALLMSFGPKERKKQTRQLRSLLLHSPHFLFISTTPTYHLNNALDDPKEPLYAHLKERDLDHLTEPETEQLLRKLAQLHPREGSENFLDGKDGRLRLRVIHQLTGGLPRSLVMAFTTIREAAGIGSLVQELRALLDAQTAYFEARLSQLPPRERAVVTTMALAPTNLTMKEIAQRSRLPERTLSTLISRLEKDGHVRAVSRSGGKGAVYEVSEGLFRLWYQYRKGRPVLEPLVDFLAYWYRVDELENVVTALRQGAESGSTRATELALLQAEEALRRASSEEGQRERERFWSNCQQTLLKETVNAALDDWATTAATKLLEAAASLRHPDTKAAGLREIQQIIRLDPVAGEQTRSLLFLRLFNAIARQHSSSDPKDLLTILSITLEHFQNHPDDAIQSSVVRIRLLLATLFWHSEPQRIIAETALALSSTAIDDPQLRLHALFFRGLAFNALGDFDSAVSTLEEFIAAPADRNAWSQDPETVLTAMRIVSRFHARNGQVNSIRRISKAIISRFSSRQEEPFRFEVANARGLLALLTRDPNRIQALEEWVSLYGNSTELRYRLVAITVRVELSIHKSTQDTSLAYKLLDECVDSLSSNAQVAEIHLFLHRAVDLFVRFGSTRMAGWLSRLLTASTSEEGRLIISWHLMAAELLAADDQRGGTLSSSSESISARIPPELRQNVTDLVKRIRELQLRAA